MVRESVVANFATTAADGKTYQVDYYNLDVIISVGYRVKSKRGTQFRIWAFNILKEYMRKDEVNNADTAISVHYSVGREVRSAIEKIGGTMPEDLPTPEKSIQQIEKEQMARLKAKAKKGKLMLDE